MFPHIWTKENYQSYLNYLISIKEDKYKEFHSKLCKTKYKILGIRLPIIRKIAKEIIKTDYKSFFKQITNTYYEEVMIEGLVLASIKEENLFFTYFENYIKKIDNWAITDSFCNTICLPINTENFNYFQKLALNEEEFISRVGLIIILNHYVDKKYIKQIFKLLDKIKSDKYYVNMAEAWLVCELYTKYSNDTEKYLLNNKLNDFTFNKAISKMRDSYRISKEKKEYLRNLKR
ncbi:MAG: DNA alkylation repair protein [Bacilli bacterium]